MEKSGLLNNGWIASTTYLSGFPESNPFTKDVAVAEERIGNTMASSDPKINGMALNLNLCGCMDVAGTRINLDVSKSGGGTLEIVSFDNDGIGEKLSPEYNYMSAEIPEGNYIKKFAQKSATNNDNININIGIVRVVEGDNVYMSITSKDGNYSTDIAMKYDPKNPDYPKEMEVYVRGINSGEYLHSAHKIEIEATESGLHFSIPQTMEGAQELSEADFNQNPARSATKGYVKDLFESAKDIAERIVNPQIAEDETPIQKGGNNKAKPNLFDRFN